MIQSAQPLVSIIMTTYNRAGYIGETINNIQGQTYKHWELLIEDDDSDDNTEGIVNSLGDKRIYYTRHNHTAITGKLKNLALQRAKGEFIAFMDSDDLWTADKLQQQVTQLQQNPTAGFSVTNWCDFYQPGKLEPAYHKPNTGISVANIFKEYSTARLLFHITTLIFRKSCLEKTGMFNENRLFTDYSFVGRLAYYYDAIVFYEPMLLHRVHAANNISTNWAADFEEYQEAAKQFIKDDWIDYKTVSQTLFFSYINLGEKFMGIKDKHGAIKNYLKAWQYKPFSIIPAKKLVKTLFL